MVNKKEKGTQYKRMSSNDFIDNYEIVFKTYGWTYWDLMCVPIPVFINTLGALNRRLKREEKQLKDSQKKGKIKHGAV